MCVASYRACNEMNGLNGCSRYTWYSVKFMPLSGVPIRNSWNCMCFQKVLTLKTSELDTIVSTITVKSILLMYDKEQLHIHSDITTWL